LQEIIKNDTITKPVGKSHKQINVASLWELPFKYCLKHKNMKSSNNQLTGSLKGKTSVYLPEKRMWVYANTQKQANNYILRLKAQDSAIQAARQTLNKPKKATK
jgi:hypothetical protein